MRAFQVLPPLDTKEMCRYYLQHRDISLTLCLVIALQAILSSLRFNCSLEEIRITNESIILIAFSILRCNSSKNEIQM